MTCFYHFQKKEKKFFGLHNLYSLPMDGVTLDIYVMSRSTDVYEHVHALPGKNLPTHFCKLDLFIEIQQNILSLLNDLAYKNVSKFVPK